MSSSLAANPSATGAQISWNCEESTGDTSQFIVTYTLTNKDNCNAWDNLLNKQQTTVCTQCNRMPTHQSYIYSFSMDLAGLYAYSMYYFTVQPIVGSLYGNGFSGTFTTEEESKHDPNPGLIIAVLI